MALGPARCFALVRSVAMPCGQSGWLQVLTVHVVRQAGFVG